MSGPYVARSEVEWRTLTDNEPETKLVSRHFKYVKGHLKVPCRFQQLTWASKNCLFWRP